MSPKLFFSYFSLNSFIGVSFIYVGFTAVVNSSGFLHMVTIGCNYTIEMWENSRQAPISDKIDGKNFDLSPLSPKISKTRWCVLDSAWLRCRGNAWALSFCAAQVFLPFYEILNLTLTLYLKAKPSIETVVVHFTNLALMLFPFTGSISLRSHREEDKGKLL